MARRRSAAEAVAALTEVESLILRGVSVSAACREIGVTPQSFYRWRSEHAACKNEVRVPVRLDVDGREEVRRKMGVGSR